MKLRIDQTADAAYLQVREGEVAESREIDVDTYVDLDAAGNVIGYEFLRINEYLRDGSLSITIPEKLEPPHLTRQAVFG